VTKAGEAGPFERKIFKTEPPPEESETVMGVPAAEDAEVAKMEEGPVASMMQRTISSISEAANLASGGWDAPWFLRWFEIPFQVKNPKDGKLLPEATGWAMDSCGRGPLNQVGGFIGAAVLRLATVDAGCINPGDCDNTLKGLKPSSLLTTTSALVGVIAAILMPAVGAVVDHTRHRKLMAVLSGIIVVGMTGIQISISIERNNWFFILVVDAIQSFFLLVHSTAVFAYLPDLTTDEEVIPHYSSHFQIRQYAVQFLFASLLAIAGRVRGSDRTALESSVQTARDGAGMAFGFGALFFSYAWIFLFRKRPALSKVPEGQNLVSTGFVKVKKTFSKIQKDYRALRWFLFSLLWSPDAGAGVVLSIAISFLTVEIGFTGQDFAKVSRK
jgi:MFS-type transporter involved in bile tolerance (Atg22 family)